MLIDDVVGKVGLDFLIDTNKYEQKTIPLFQDNSKVFHFKNKALETCCLPNFYRNFKVKPIHSHDYYEIELCFGGKGIHTMNNETVPIEKGTAIFIRPGVQHTYENTTEYLDMFTMMFSPSFFEINEEWRAAFARDAKSDQYICKIDDDAFLRIKLLCALVSHLFYFEDDNLQFKETFKLTLDMIFAEYGKSNASNYKRRFVKDVDDFIKANINRKITLEMIADHVFVERKYLSAKYKKESGMYLVDRINEIKIEAAKRLLVSSNLKIIDIAYECGMYNISNFNRVFKRITGKTPAEFRCAGRIYT